MTNLKNVLELIIVLQKSGWSEEQIIDFANTFHRIVQDKAKDPDFIPSSDDSD